MGLELALSQQVKDWPGLPSRFPTLSLDWEVELLALALSEGNLHRTPDESSLEGGRRHRHRRRLRLRH